MKTLLLALALYHPSAPWIPPARFDVPYPGQMFYKQVDAWELVDYCGGNAWACTLPHYVGGPCVIILPKTSAVIDRNMIANLIRHETGHCNGWSPEHER